MARQWRMGRRAGGGRRGGAKSFGAKLAIAGVIAAVAIMQYCAKGSYNEITGEKQYVDLSVDQEIALGLQAAPQVTAQHGGKSSDPKFIADLARVGAALVNKSDAGMAPYQFEFHALADPETVNAFALPGGQMFITKALYDRFETEGQLAGVMGHEIGHVVARHGAEHLAKAKLTQGLSGAAVVAASDQMNSRQAAQVAAAIGNVVNMKFGRADELESDRLGVRFMSQAGYDPRSLIDVMKILDEASKGNRPPEFFSTHPNPDNRIEMIEAAIAAEFPDGIPDGLIP